MRSGYYQINIMAANEDLEINPREDIKADLFTKTMKGKWSDVVDIYKQQAWTHKEKITKSGETALHIAVISGNQEETVKQLIQAIQSQPDQNHAKEAVNVKNMQGNTALHCAVSKEKEEPVMCKSIAEVDSSLVGCRNNEGETPFFLAALHGKKDAFLYFHGRICSEANPDAGYAYSTRNVDVNTILHSAINGQHFELAYRITQLYKNLANTVNNKGLYPLHILAAKPSAFGSGSRARLDPRRNSYSVRRRKHMYWAHKIMEQLLEHTELYQGPKTWGDSSTNLDSDQSDHHGSPTHVKKDHDEDGDLTPILTAAKYGVIEMVERILKLYPIAIYDVTTVTRKNIVLLAVEYRQIHVYQFLLQNKTIHRDSVFGHLDKDGNTALHIAAKLAPGTPGMIPGLQMLWEIKWYEYVKGSMPLSVPLHNQDGETPIGLFNKNHKELIENGGNWLSRTSESSSVVATLIAGVAFATATNIPGGLKQDSDTRTPGENKVALYIFAISSLVALFSSVTSVVLFFALMSSSFEVKNFSSDLPKKLLTGLVTLFIGIASILISFCAQHIFMLQDMKNGALVVYAVVVALVIFMTIKNSSVFLNLLRLSLRRVPAPQRLNEDDF